MKITKNFALPVAILALAFVASSASAQVTGPRVALQFATNGLTNPLVSSQDNAVVARLLLDTTGSSESVRIASLPFNLITGGGASAGTLTNCRVYNETNLSDELNTPVNSTTGLTNGINTINFDSALVISPNSLVTLSLRCDIGSDLVAGGTYTVNMNTNNVVATGASTGLAASVTIRGSVVIPPVIIPPVVPGMPSTGATSGATQTLAMLALSLVGAGIGYSYLGLSRKNS